MTGGHELLGFLGAGIAALFFGSNYVPTKNYKTGDGIAFVWSFSAGVLIVGFIASFFATRFEFVATGLLGGSLWATGNLCVIPIVKTIGLGPGMLIWGSTSLIVGFLTGKFGLFHLEKQVVPHNVMNWIALIFVVLAMIVFFFIKPTVEKREEYQTLNGEKSHEEVEVSIVDRIPQKFRGIIGGSLAVGSGVLYGVNMVPMMLWSQHQKNTTGITPKPLDFVFSHFMGIYLFSSTVFVIYCIYNAIHRQAPKIYAEAVFPSMISGAMWGIAQCGLMSATQILGYTVGFPIGSAGPLIVSSLWSVLYFREIRGARNIVILLISFGLLFIGIMLLALSQMTRKF